jgi:signal transduction histidine kinase
MFHDDGRASLELAMTTMAAARRHSSFADAVRSSTRRPFHESWRSEFTRFPRWARLLDSVGEELPPELPADWRWSAELEAFRQHAGRQALRLQVLGADADLDAADAARRLAAEEIGAEAAVWIGENGEVGIGVVDGKSIERCRRMDFERRSRSWELRSSNSVPFRNDWQAVVYSSVPVRLTVEWAEIVAKRRWSERSSRKPIARNIDAEVEARYWSAVSEFGAGAGHMINNPLGAIAGLAERLIDGEAEPERRTSLHKIKQQVDRVHRMIRDLHLLGRPSSEQTSSSSFADCVANGVAKAQSRWLERPTARITISNLSVDVPVGMYGSDLVRVVEELVANAIESAGADGFVEIKAERTANGCTLAVIDSGPGFSDEERANAFSPFFAGRSAGRGLGMGLPVCRRLLERVGGRIVLERRRPTTVTVHLPLAEASALRRAA